MIMKEIEYIDIPLNTILASKLKAEDFFTPDALLCLRHAEFGGVVAQEEGRILVSNIDGIGQWVPFNGKKIRAEQIEDLLNGSYWMLPKPFQPIADDERLLQYDLQPVSGAYYYANHYFPVEHVIFLLQALSNCTCNCLPVDGAYLIFPME